MEQNTFQRITRDGHVHLFQQGITSLAFRPLSLLMYGQVERGFFMKNLTHRYYIALLMHQIWKLPCSVESNFISFIVFANGLLNINTLVTDGFDRIARNQDIITRKLGYIRVEGRNNRYWKKKRTDGQIVASTRKRKYTYLCRMLAKSPPNDVF
jgi:hypothetical protein